MKNICVLGNYSGRNAGDAALLGGLLEDVTRRYQGINYVIPTIKPAFIRANFSRYPVKPVSLMPWNLSLKILGLPVLASTLGADLILVTDAILFDLHLFNPLHNYLFTLSHVLPLAKRRRVPVVLYNMSLGPVRTKRGERCLRRILDCADLIIVRDAESVDLVKRFGGYEHKFHVGADCALNVVPSSDARLGEIKRRESILSGRKATIGFNINAYIDAFLHGGRGGMDRDLFLKTTGAVIDRAVKALDVDVLLVVTQIMDLQITEELKNLVRNRDRIKLISNKDYSHEDLAKVLSKLDIFIGMRTHSLIIATAVGTPVAGIISYPKNRGYLRSIGMGDQRIEFSDYTEDNLWRLVEKTWKNRHELKKKLLPVMDKEKARARQSAELLKPFLE